jgi:catalase
MPNYLHFKIPRNTLVLTLLSATISLSASFVIGAEATHESPKSIIDSMHSAFGKHHARAVHAKGIILEGSFNPASEAKQLSKASLFSGSTIPVTVRFSDFTGIPDIPDNSENASPRGLAIKFQLSDGSSTDIVTHAFNGFPVATADEFAQLMRAIGTSGPSASKPTALDKFLGDHPIAKTFLTTQKPAPVSYATLTYFGVNAFKFVNKNDAAVYVRYRFVPKAGEQFLEPSLVKAKDANYLTKEIDSRLAKSTVVFEWFAQISENGDVVTNPSVAWPETRKLVKLGTITITKVATDQPSKDKATIFIPGNVQSGIEVADPMVAVRSAAYPISFSERQ